MAEPTAETPPPSAAGFARHAMTLAAGTAFAQLLLVLAVPVLTRLYTPADYGALAVYSSTLTVLLVAASLRYETAIPLPDDEQVAGALLGLSVMLLVVLSMFVALLVWLAGDAFVAAVKAPALRPYLWLLPLGFFGAGMYQVLSYWAIRKREFGRIARTKLTQGIGQVVTQVGLG
jgi:O-antigen/teichoic acid export membrane protein